MAIIIPRSKEASTELRPVLGQPFHAPERTPNPLEGITRILNQEVDKDNKIKANDAINELKSGLQIRGYGGEGVDGYYSKQGIDAVEGSKSFIDGNEAFSEEIAKRLNPIQKQIFNKYSASILLSTAGSAQVFANNQRKVGAINSLKAQESNALSGVSLDYTKEGRQLNHASGRVAVFERMRQEGADTEVTKSALNDFDSSYYYTAVTSSIANGDIETAKEILNMYGDKISPVKRNGLIKSLSSSISANQEDNDLATSQYYLDTYYDASQSLNDNMTMAKNINNPNVRKLYEAGVRRQKADNKLSQTHESEQLVIKYSGQPVSSIPGEDRAMILPSDLKRLHSTDKFESGYNDNDLLKDLSTMSREEIKNINISNMQSLRGYKISSNGFKKAVELKKKMMDGSVSLRNSTIKRAMSAMQIVMSNKRGQSVLDKKVKAYNQAYMNIQLMVGRLVSNSIDKKEEKGDSTILDDNEINSIINKTLYMGKMTREGWLWGNNEKKLGIEDIPFPEFKRLLNGLNRIEPDYKGNVPLFQRMINYAAIYEEESGKKITGE